MTQEKFLKIDKKTRSQTFNTNLNKQTIENFVTMETQPFY